MKRQIASHIQLDVGSRPFNESVLDLLRVAKQEGRPLVLATASDVQLARLVAERVGLFSKVLASDRNVNLRGRAKCDALLAKFGRRGKPGPRRKPLAVRVRVLELCAQERYADFGPTLPAEHLARQQIAVNHETLRRWLLAGWTVARGGKWYQLDRQHEALSLVRRKVIDRVPCRCFFYARCGSRTATRRASLSRFLRENGAIFAPRT